MKVNFIFLLTSLFLYGCEAQVKVEIKDKNKLFEERVAVLREAKFTSWAKDKNPHYLFAFRGDRAFEVFFSPETANIVFIKEVARK